MGITVINFLVATSLAAELCAESPDLKLLVRQLHHENADSREDAANAIGALGRKAVPAIPALILALKDRDANVSVAAAYAIADIGPAAKDAVPALIAALSDNRNASWGSLPGGQATVEGAAWSALHNIGGAAANPVAPFMKSKNSQHRALAAWVISAADGAAEPHVPQIVALLDDHDKYVRYEAVNALGKITTVPEITIPALTSALKSKDVNMRLRACIALSRHGSAASEAVAALTEQLRHDNSTLRGFAAYSLGQIGDAATPALPELRRLANDDGFVFNQSVPEHGLTDTVQDWAREAAKRIERPDRLRTP